MAGDSIYSPGGSQGLEEMLIEPPQILNGRAWRDHFKKPLALVVAFSAFGVGVLAGIAGMIYARRASDETVRLGTSQCESVIRPVGIGFRNGADAGEMATALWVGVVNGRTQVRQIVAYDGSGAIRPSMVRTSIWADPNTHPVAFTLGNLGPFGTRNTESVVVHDPNIINGDHIWVSRSDPYEVRAGVPEDVTLATSASTPVDEDGDFLRVISPPTALDAVKRSDDQCVSGFSKSLGRERGVELAHVLLPNY